MLLKKKKDFKLTGIVILALLFLGTVNLANLYFYFIFVAASAVILLNLRALRVDWVVVVLLLFALCYIIFYPGVASNIKTILKYILYPMCYVMGLNFVTKEDNTMDNERTYPMHKLLFPL